MKFSVFEKQIQQTLYNREEPLDTDSLIWKIFQKEEKKRRIIPFWWIITGVVMCTGIIMSFYFSQTNAISVVNTNGEKNVSGKNIEVDGELSTSNSVVHEETKNSVVEPNDGTNTTMKKPFTDFDKNVSASSFVSSGISESNNTKSESSYPLSLHQNNSIFSENQKNEVSKNISGFPFLNTEIHQVVALNRFFPKKRKVECPSFSLKKKWRFFIQPDAGVSKPQKTLQERLPDNSQVTAFRKEHEKTIEGIHAGVQAGLFLGKSPFYASAGFSYTRISEKLDLVYNYTELDTTYGIVSITKSENGDTVTVIYGDIVTEKSTKGQKIKHHYFHLLDIPLIFGYQYDLSNRWSLGISGGVILNVGLRTNGQVLSTLNDFKPIEKDKYHTTLGLGYRCGVDVEYAMTPSFAFGINTRLTGYGKSFSSPYSNFRQNYLIPGIHIFGRYHFSL